MRLHNSKTQQLYIFSYPKRTTMLTVKPYVISSRFTKTKSNVLSFAKTNERHTMVAYYDVRFFVRLFDQS